MWASTRWPFVSSTRNDAFGNASTTLPSTSMTPSFLAKNSANVDELDTQARKNARPTSLAHDEGTLNRRKRQHTSALAEGVAQALGCEVRNPLIAVVCERAHDRGGRAHIAQ